MILKNVKIDKIIFKGFGLGSYQGKKVFIPFTYPGDVLDARVLSEKKDYYKALPHTFYDYGPERVDVDCPSFKECGGCNSLDISYSDQCSFKKEVINDIFSQHTSIIKETVASPKQFHYRNKVFFPLANVNGLISFGMFKNMTHSVVSANNCKLVEPMLIDIAKEICLHLNATKEKVYQEKTKKGNIRHIGFRINRNNDVMVIIVTNKSKLAFTNTLVTNLRDKFPNIISVIQNINKSDSNRILASSDKVLYGQPYFIDYISDKPYKIHYQSFFQVNRELTEIIYEQIKEDVDENSNVLDAYSGVSTIGIYLAQKAKQVVSVESNEWACQDALYNVDLNKLNNLRIINAKLQDDFQNIISEFNIDTIVFDPPRKGLDSKIRSLIKDSAIKKIIYLSCNPTTQKRDVDDFITAGFSIERIIPFDMFPNTYHVENYIVLTR